MDESLLFNGVMRALLGGRRRRGRRAMGYMASAGSTLLSHPTALLTAAGVAWGIFETLQGGAQAPGAPGAAGFTTAGAGFNSGGAGLDTSGAGLNTAAAPVPETPPLPAMGGVAGPMTDATRMVRLALSAAQADGALSAEEKSTVLARANEAGLADRVERELQQPLPLADIVRGVTDPGQRATLYSLAFAVARADEQVGGAERIYLAQLANLLGLDPAAVQQLEAAAATKIDAGPERT
jgi:tellurite resistance protein